MQPFKIPSPGDKPLVIAEIALAHDGSLGNAIAYIRACADAGADAVKFQCHDGDPNDLWRTGVEHPQDKTRADYWWRTGFNLGELWQLKDEAARCGVWFGVTPFSIYALRKAVAAECDFIKMARRCASTTLHRAAIATSLPVIHTGVGMLTSLGLDAYRLGVNIGISCHAPSIAPALDAVRRGALIVEKHICWDRRQFGPDTEFSITIDELSKLCETSPHKGNPCESLAS